MAASRIHIVYILTDTLGLSAIRIMDYLLSDAPCAEENCRSLIDRRVKTFVEDVMGTVHGNHILEEQKFKITHAKTHINFNNKSIDEIETELFLRSRQHYVQIKRIATVSGIMQLSTLFIPSEIGVDMSPVESECPLCSWAYPCK